MEFNKLGSTPWFPNSSLPIVHHHRDSAADDRPPRQKSQASRRKPGVGGKTQKVHWTVRSPWEGVYLYICVVTLKMSIGQSARRCVHIESKNEGLKKKHYEVH